MVLWQMSLEETRGLLRFLESNLESILRLVYSVNCTACVGVTGRASWFLNDNGGLVRASLEYLLNSGAQPAAL